MEEGVREEYEFKTSLSAQHMPRGRGSGRWNNMNCWNEH